MEYDRIIVVVYWYTMLITVMPIFFFEIMTKMSAFEKDILDLLAAKHLRTFFIYLFLSYIQFCYVFLQGFG